MAAAAATIPMSTVLRHSNVNLHSAHSMPRRFDQAPTVVTAMTNGQQMLCSSNLDGSDCLHRIETRDGTVDFTLFGVMLAISAALCPSLCRPGIPERLVNRHLGQCFGDKHPHP